MLNAMLNADAKREWRQHWPLVAAVMAGLAVASIHLFGMGVMIEPLESEFGWTRAEITSGFIISSIMSIPTSPLIGWMVDRYGPRLIALIGTTIYCLGLASLSLAVKPLWMWWSLWFFLLIGYQLVRPTVWVAAIASAFSASRGLALAVALCAQGFASIFIPFLTYLCVDNFGWRATFLFWGCAGALLALPAMFLFLHTGLDDIYDKLRATPTKTVGLERGITIRSALRGAVIYKMSLAALASTLTTVAITVNLVPILNSSGIAMAASAAIAGIYGVSQIIGRLGCGHLLDRFDARFISGIVFVVPALTCFMLLAFEGSPAIAAIAILIFGFAIGAEVDILGYLCSRYFSGRNFGTLFGIIMAVTALSGAGSVLANFIFDRTGSYDLVLWAGIPLSILSGALFMSLGPYPAFDTSLGKADEIS